MNIVDRITRPGEVLLEFSSLDLQHLGDILSWFYFYFPRMKWAWSTIWELKRPIEGDNCNCRYRKIVILTNAKVILKPLFIVNAFASFRCSNLHNF